MDLSPAQEAVAAIGIIVWLILLGWWGRTKNKKGR
jgi:uncharacterized membrane protein YccF (DUF307 family)